ncbi:MAG TPA: AAA family ATPase [Candidatus Saccharimonadales bacterium]|nr:AAA family ATPase [Candidatus Saccharimonadales bacterium]
MSGLLLHDKTKKQAELFLRKPANSLLILGSAGSGKLNLAISLAQELLKLESTAKLTNHPYFLHIKKPDAKQDISIDTIREVIRFLRLKALGNGGIRRVVIIENAQHLSIEAQNALLKILEEPNDDTVFILTAPNEQSLLPTIVSRCQTIQVYPISLAQAINYYKAKFNQKVIESTWQLSQGNSALMDALLNDDQNHPLKQAIDEAKKFLRQSKYERLLYLDKISKNKESTALFLEALNKVLAALHHTYLAKNRQQSLAQMLLSDRKLVRQSADAIDGNGNLKLISLELLLNLRD